MNKIMMKEIAKEIHKKEKEDNTFNSNEILEKIMVKEGVFIGEIIQNEYKKLKEIK